jgi:hypothetical protein
MTCDDIQIVRARKRWPLVNRRCAKCLLLVFLAATFVGDWNRGPLLAQAADRAVAPNEATRVLKDWLQEHRYYPVDDACLVVVNVDRPTASMTGRLEVLEDARLTDAVRPVFDRTGRPRCETADGELRTLCDAMARQPIRPPLVRLVDRNGRERDRHVLDRELADVQPVRLYGVSGPVTYLVSNDVSAGFGSYSGPVTYFAEIRNGQLIWLQVENVQTRERHGWILMSSLKAAWRVDDGPKAVHDVFAVSSAPVLTPTPKGDAELPFQITLTRYHFNGTQWIEFNQSQPGLWESEQAFPSETEFPPADRAFSRN